MYRRAAKSLTSGPWDWGASGSNERVWPNSLSAWQVDTGSFGQSCTRTRTTWSNTRGDDGGNHVQNPLRNSSGLFPHMMLKVCFKPVPQFKECVILHFS